ncbi:5-(carboxyamino)imidazole ribonucleotide synthase [Marinagarivorans algicola]|uniref:5-(carboxyamino)imidazole ribonucleotide synthase n=1 Tax=Marinagarivorans algicola TaxID=1513270 RepID=UPI0006B5FDB2|nr:5-(carboxyamino)imidazole ribonucleotide synthase [Marinagarivorans algicola]
MRIAVLGTGQLARMMALEGIAMGVEFSFLKTPGEDSRCVEHLGCVVEASAGDSAAQIYALLGKPDVVTTEKEGVSVVDYEQFLPYCAVSPPAKAVWVTQNRLREKNFLNDQGVPTAAYKPADTLAQVTSAAQALGFPVIVKTQENGYDGKGQWWLDSVADITKMHGDEASGPWLLEKVVPFEREVSVVAARSANGEVAVYPISENVHKNGILLTSFVPVVQISASQAAEVNAHITRIMQELEYVGVLSMECFVTAQGIVANELAPRVHNSGHWTQSAMPASQFEQHVRAILNWPLAPTQMTGAAGMLNLLGVAVEPSAVLKPRHALHWYGKAVRPGRKVGHINITAPTPEALREQLKQLESDVYA